MEFPKPDRLLLPDQIPCTRSLISNETDPKFDRIRGSLIGLAVGDALGASVEFRPREYLRENPITNMTSGGTWGLKAGQWTDDTSMALCLASSLITRKRFDLYDQLVRYKWWYKHGYLSSTGSCFDIGHATCEALEEFCRRQNRLKEHFKLQNDDAVDHLTTDQIKQVWGFNLDCSQPDAAGNGALMRLAPVPLYFYRNPAVAVELAGLSARPTHADPKAVDACRYYAALIVAALNGETKDQLLSSQFYENHDDWFKPTPLHDDVLQIAHGSYQRQNGYDDGIRGKGYVISSLEAALWAFWSDEGSFEKGALNAVNLGDDTDTTAAIYGQLAGAFYGYGQIPGQWKLQLYAHDLIVCIAEWLSCLDVNVDEENRRVMISQNQALLSLPSLFQALGSITKEQLFGGVLWLVFLPYELFMNYWRRPTQPAAPSITTSVTEESKDDIEMSEHSNNFDSNV